MGRDDRDGEEIGLGIVTAPGVDVMPGGRGGYTGVGMAVRLWGLEAAESSASRSHRRTEWQYAFWRTASDSPDNLLLFSSATEAALLPSRTLKCTTILLRAGQNLDAPLSSARYHF